MSDETGSRRASTGPIPDQVPCKERKTISPVLTPGGMERISIAHIQVVGICHATYLHPIGRLILRRRGWYIVATIGENTRRGIGGTVINEFGPVYRDRVLGCLYPTALACVEVKAGLPAW